MSTTSIIIVVSVVVGLSVPLAIRFVKSARAFFAQEIETGYEDDSGYHTGLEPGTRD